MAAGGRLAPRDFNKMYYLASEGKVGFLREAVNRGLNIDAVNPNGDTGLCIAIKRHDYVAYNSFRMSGANPRHPCTYRMLKEYREFLESRRAASMKRMPPSTKCWGRSPGTPATSQAGYITRCRCMSFPSATTAPIKPFSTRPSPCCVPPACACTAMAPTCMKRTQAITTSQRPANGWKA